MPIALRASASGDISSSTATVTPTKPTGTASTDALVYGFATDNGASTTTTITAPAGFSRIGVTVLGSSGVNRIKLDGFICLGSQVSMGFTNSHTGTSFQQGWVGLAFTGVDNVNPIDVADGTGNTGTGAATLVVNGVTIVTDQAWDCQICCDWNSGVVTSTGFTVVENGHTNAMVAALYNQTPKSTGATGTATISDSASATSQIMAALRFALRPASGGTAETYPAGHRAPWRNPLLKQRVWTPRGRRWDVPGVLGGGGDGVDVWGGASPAILSRRARRDRRNLLESAQRERRQLCQTAR